ncbi:unnamed protein product [Adineta ricciae]|uniref:Helix-turn-helix domain-containing protein n=1 Tax=Adineta ricciae TaxID=249248 RepID=A0A816EJL2_ADIRI|nr:unnamed protein product [Adineta ricciae]CAF1650622.1 unnamed protein product [Adineta ricciae]
MQHKDPNISISYKIDSANDCLDVAIENNLGHLKTSIFHKSSAEPYILPYTSDHPHHIHRNIPYAALLRAARLCSNIREFDMERIRIDVSLLLNDYPFDFIAEHFQRFFDINNAQKLSRREKQLQSMMQNYDQVPGALVVKPWNTKLMYLKFIFESGPTRNLQPAFYKCWTKWYKYSGSIVGDVKVTSCIHTNPTLERLFVRKKPAKELLQKLN